MGNMQTITALQKAELAIQCVEGYELTLDDLVLLQQAGKLQKMNAAILTKDGMVRECSFKFRSDTATANKATTQKETIESLQREVETLRAQLAEEVERADARAITDPCELFLLSTFRGARKKDRFKLLKSALKAAGKSNAEA